MWKRQEIKEWRKTIVKDEKGSTQIVKPETEVKGKMKKLLEW